MKFITIKYKCGTTFSQQHNDLFDGPWVYGELNEIVYYKDENYMWIDDCNSIYPYTKLNKDEK